MARSCWITFNSTPAASEVHLAVDDQQLPLDAQLAELLVQVSAA
jgi:hypothetical protein